MSSSLPDNIKPVAQGPFHDLFLPLMPLGLRWALALLVLIYVALRPEISPLYMPFFMVGVLIYIVLQTGLTVLMLKQGRANHWLYALTGVDGIGVVLCIVNDPSSAPPTMSLTAGALALTVIQYRGRAFFIAFAAIIISTLIALLAHHQLQSLALDYELALLCAFLLLATGTSSVLMSLHADSLRSRAAHIAETDPETGLGNRWTLYEAAKYLLPYHLRNMTPMVMMLADIDENTDADVSLSSADRVYVLRHFASIIDRRLRSCDIAVHYGEHEFACLLVDTATKEAEAIAFDVQQQFDSWAKQKNLPVHVQIGLAVVPNKALALDQILMSITAALARARHYKRGASGAVFADPEQIR